MYVQSHYLLGTASLKNMSGCISAPSIKLFKPNIEEGGEEEVTHSVNGHIQLIKAYSDINSYAMMSQRVFSL